jgi:hypothetical protein
MGRDAMPETAAAPAGGIEALCSRAAGASGAHEEGALDFAFPNDLDGVPNRARVKIFRPKGQGRLVVFFYKKSLLPHSRDRFAYGCCVVREGGAGDADAAAWFAYAASGFAVEKRPPGWMRGVPFDVPE